MSSRWCVAPRIRASCIASVRGSDATCAPPPGATWRPCAPSRLRFAPSGANSGNGCHEKLPSSPPPPDPDRSEPSIVLWDRADIGRERGLTARPGVDRLWRAEEGKGGPREVRAAAAEDGRWEGALAMRRGWALSSPISPTAPMAASISSASSAPADSVNRAMASKTSEACAHHARAVSQPRLGLARGPLRP
eukprot:272796-Prorocentrum_minimum.AAC.1